MRLRKSQVWILTAVVIAIAAVSAAILLRKHAPPEPARLLPDGEAVFYVNLQTARTFTQFGEGSVSVEEPETEEFSKETGIEWRRDLDEAAFSVHGPVRGIFGTGPSAPQTRLSEVLVGRFNTSKLSEYLRKRANDVDQYRGATVYSIPLQGRTVRVAILSVDTVAASNVDGAQDIHGIIDRYRASALPFGGPKLVRSYYKRVPIASAAWAILRTGAGEQNSATLPSGISLFVPEDTKVIASVRALSAIHARAEFVTPSEDAARRLKAQSEALLGLFRSLDTGGKPLSDDPALKVFFDGLSVEQDGNRTVLSASIPFGFFQQLLSEPPAQLAPEKQTPPEPVPAAPRKKKK